MLLNGSRTNFTIRDERMFFLESPEPFSPCDDRKTDALDIDRESEYSDMVRKLHSNQWKKVHVIFDMEDIKKRCLVGVGG
jgi:hypothetical protein